MALTWDGFAKKLQANEKVNHWELYQIAYDDYEDHFEEVFDLCLKMLDQVDFTKDNIAGDSNAEMAHTLVQRCLPGGNQVKRKNKEKLFEGIVRLLTKIKDKPFQHEEACAPKCLEPVTWILAQADLLTKKYVPSYEPLMADILKQKKVSKRVYQNLMSPLHSMTMNCTDDCKNIGPILVKICFEEEYLDYMSMVSNLYSICPDEINKHVKMMFELIEEENRYAAHLPMLLQKIAPRNPELLVPHLKLLVNKMCNDKVMYSLYCMIVADISSKCIKDLAPYMEQISNAFMNQEVGIVAYGGKIIVAFYKDSKDEKKIKEVYDLLFARVKKDPEMYATSPLACVLDFAKNSELHKKILKDNYFKIIEGYLQSNTGYVKTYAQTMIDYLEDRTLEKLDQRIDVVEDKVDIVEEKTMKMEKDVVEIKQDSIQMKQDIKEVKEDVKTLDARLTSLEQVVEDHKKWVQENLDQIRTSMAKLGKVLPIPVNMTVKSNVIDTIHLHFICAYRNEGKCRYPGDNGDNCNNTFITQTKEINKWCKIGVQAVSLGFKIFNGDIYNGLANIKNMWDIYSDKREDKFETWTQEPFLTSSEQDELILQLRKSTFYSEFTYDPEHNGWSCNYCLGKQVIIDSSKAAKNANDEAKAMLGEVLDTTKNVFTPMPPNQGGPPPQGNKDQNMKVASELAEQIKEVQESAGCSCTVL